MSGKPAPNPLFPIRWGNTPADDVADILLSLVLQDEIPTMFTSRESIKETARAALTRYNPERFADTSAGHFIASFPGQYDLGE